MKVVDLWTLKGFDNQKFRIFEDDHIQAVHSRMMLDCAYGNGG